MKIIITGATGFVGQNFQKYLKEKRYEVETLSLRSADWRSNIERNAMAIFHLAGKAHDTANTSVDGEYFKVNRDLTVELFDFFLRSNIRDFFYFSSVKAVADTLDGVLTEEKKGRPVTAYGKSKQEAEEHIL
ncbi:MAG: NAD-dependent epimerase/dehydratase family protein, partial [Sphingobacterium sp.]